MKFKVNKGPFLRNKRTTTSIMLELFAVLCVIWGVSIAFYATKFNAIAGLRVFGIGGISILTTIIVDIIVALIKGKRKLKDILEFVIKSYSYVTAIIFALCLPAGTSFYVVVVGALVATIIGKYVFGGFGNNIFNPAIIGRIFVGLSFSDKLQTIKVAKDTSYGIDLVSGATLTGSIDWTTGVSSFTGNNKVSLLGTLFGEYQGAIGETFTALLVVAGIYLLVRGIINYRLVLGYLLTATLCSFGIALANGVEFDMLGKYMLMSLSTGGLMFAAVFMITDPVTSPKSQDGKLIYASLAGFLSIFIRVFSSYPEGVMFSIALANMVTPIIDQSIKGNTFDHLAIRFTKIVSVPVIGALLSSGYALIPFEQDQAQLPSKSEGGTVKVDTGVTKISDSLYQVKKSGMNGDITLAIRVDRLANKITAINIVGDLPNEEYASDWTSEVPSGYIGENLNIDFSVFDGFSCSGMCMEVENAAGDYDITSGATVTSSAVINGIKSVIEEIKKETTLSYTKTGNVYRVTKIGFYSDTPIVIDIEVSGETIVKATLVSSNPDEANIGSITMDDYDSWFGETLNINFDEIDSIVKTGNVYVQTDDTSELDVVTGASITGSAIVEAFKEVVDAVRGEVA